MLDNYYSVLLPNGNRFCNFDKISNSLDSYRKSTIASIIFGVYGVKSKDKVSIVNIDTMYSVLHYMQNDRNFMISKVIGESKKVFVVHNNLDIPSVKRYILDFRRYLLDYNVNTYFINVKDIEKNIENYSKYFYFYNLILNDSSFQISSISKIREEVKKREQMKSDEDRLEKALRDKEIIENRHKNKNSAGDEIARRIQNMDWIDHIGASRDGLIIKTKQMQMRHVPNIGKYVEPSHLSVSNVYYKIFKNQCLGNNFILLPEEYIVPYDFNIKCMNTVSSQKNELLNILSPLTYFKGANPHIGPSGSCYGEFSAAVAASRDNGLDFLLMGFLPYLLSANLNDSAGKTVCYLPMGDENGNILCWPYMDELMRRNKVPYRGKRTEHTYLNWLKNNERTKNIMLDSRNRRDIIYTGEVSCHNESEDRLLKNLKIIEQREPEVYKIIMARIEKGERL